MAAGSSVPLSLFPFGKAGYFLTALLAILGLVMTAFVISSVPGEKREKDSLWCQKKDFFVLALAVIAIIVFWEKVFIRGWMPVNALVQYLFFPKMMLICEQLQNGLFPFWNPWSNCGQPLLADPQMGVFYPLNIPFHLFGYPMGFRIWLFLHFFFLFSFSYHWLRDKHYSVLPAALGSFLIVFNAAVVWRAGYLSHLSSLIWIPFILHALEKKSWNSLIMGFSLQLLGGHPQYFYMTLLMSGAFLVFYQQERKVWLRTCLCVGISFLVIAAQSFSSWELIRYSVRSGGLPYDMAVHYSQSLGQILKFIFIPQWALFQHDFTGDPFLMAFYAGPLSVALAFYAIWKGNRQAKIFGGFLLLLGVFLSLGGHNPLHKLLFDYIPGFNLFRYPTQWLCLAVMGLSILGAEGASKLRKQWGIAALLILLLDLFIFNIHTPFMYVHSDYLSHKSRFLEKHDGEASWTISALDSHKTAQNSMEDIEPDKKVFSGRIGLTKQVVQWLSSDLDNSQQKENRFRDWLLIKEYFLPGQGVLFHIPEAFGTTIHLLTHMNQCQTMSFQDDSAGHSARQKMSIQYLVDRENEPDGTTGFSLKKFPFGFHRFYTSEGKAVYPKIVHEYPHALELIFSSATASPVTMADAWYPGWKLLSKGRAHPVKKTQTAFRHIPVLDPEKPVVLRYDPFLFFLGMVVSFVAGLVILVLWTKKHIHDQKESLLLGWVILGAGVVFLLKSIFDLYGGQPYANFFSPVAYSFVSIKNFVRFAIAEGLTGLFCLLLSLVLLMKRKK